MFVAEGVRTVEELLRSPLDVVGLLATPVLAATERGARLLELARSRAIEVTDTSARDFATAADTDSPQGVLAIARVPDLQLDAVHRPARLLVLDGVQDPGNAGTLLRTAAAFGAAGTLAMPGTVDLWNAKVVRGAMGAHFLARPVLSCTWEEFDRFRQREGLALWAADAAGDAPGDVGELPERLALAVGNEGAGLSAEMRARADRLIGLPIAPEVESLNVAVAAGVLLYALAPRSH